jgi:hypothetical protein
MATRQTTRRSHQLKVGDRVRFSLGGHAITGIIIEDRGAIGAGGRRLFVVRVQLEATGESVFELPADELRAA